MDELILQLREELVPGAYEQVDWAAARSFIREEDLYTPHTCLLESFFSLVNVYEYVAPAWLRGRALDWIYAVLAKEDEFTNYICIGPVNKMINMLCVYVREGYDSPAFQKHIDRVPDYFWMVRRTRPPPQTHGSWAPLEGQQADRPVHQGRDGMKMNGTNGSQLWDTSFMVQALIESGLKDEFQEVFQKANDFIDLSQVN